ncbi:MAG: hypothetical protein Q4D54_08880 [Eubacteriales bacterium]|nr:hypothetical protein [Eubacteriales bacterium]
MKKRVCAVAVCAALVMTLISGCGKKDDGGDTKKKVTTEAVIPEKTTEQLTTEDQNAVQSEEAIQAYMDFLNGKSKVTTSDELYAEDDYRRDYGLALGTYSYEELKKAVAELEMDGSMTRYTFLDFGNDGIEELVLRFDNHTPDLMNWVGIIRYTGSGLELNYYYEDGYRVYSNLYTSGYLKIGGSTGAGSYTNSLIGFDGSGVGSEVFQVNEYYGPFIESLRYEVDPSYRGGSEKYMELSEDSMFSVREYRDDTQIAIAVLEWSEDETTRKKEEAVIDEFVSLGVKLLSEDEINQLSSFDMYATTEVTWEELDDELGSSNGSDVGSAVSDSTEANITIGYVSDDILAGDYYEYKVCEDDFSTQVALKTDAPIQDFTILELSLYEVSEDGQMVFTASPITSYPELTPDKSVVLTMVFMEYTPTVGISYVDACGVKHVYGISMSGYDGSVLLADVVIFE